MEGEEMLSSMQERNGMTHLKTSSSNTKQESKVMNAKAV
jgi:hypothetical protein